MPICHFPADRTGRDRAGQGLWRTPWPGAAGSGHEGAASDSGHTGTARCLKFFMPWPGWRQVALMGRGNQRLRISEEGFTGRCPPCLLGHRRVMRRSASPKLHKSLGHHVSQPARRTGRERARKWARGWARKWAEPHRITRARPTSAPTNGWSRSSTSVIWLTLVRWTGPGGASSPTISPPSPTEPGRSRSSGSRAPGRPRRPRRSRQRRHHQPPRPRRPHPPRRPRPRSPLPRPPRLLPQPPPYQLPRAQLLLESLRSLPRTQLCSLPQAQRCFLPRPHPKVPRSAGCAARRPAPSPT